MDNILDQIGKKNHIQCSKRPNAAMNGTVISAAVHPQSPRKKDPVKL